jgi:hypothetical protein
VVDPKQHIDRNKFGTVMPRKVKCFCLSYESGRTLPWLFSMRWAKIIFIVLGRIRENDITARYPLCCRTRVVDDKDTLDLLGGRCYVKHPRDWCLRNRQWPTTARMLGIITSAKRGPQNNVLGQIFRRTPRTIRACADPTCGRGCPRDQHWMYGIWS